MLPGPWYAWNRMLGSSIFVCRQNLSSVRPLQLKKRRNAKIGNIDFSENCERPFTPQTRGAHPPDLAHTAFQTIHDMLFFDAQQLCRFLFGLGNPCFVIFAKFLKSYTFFDVRIGFLVISCSDTQIVSSVRPMELILMTMQSGTKNLLCARQMHKAVRRTYFA